MSGVGERVRVEWVAGDVVTSVCVYSGRQPAAPHTTLSTAPHSSTEKF